MSLSPELTSASWKRPPPSPLSAPSLSKKSKACLRTQTDNGRITEMYAPGGILDSQTTDTQWAAQFEEETLEAGISQEHYMQFKQERTESCSPPIPSLSYLSHSTTSSPTLPSTPLLSPETLSTPMSKIKVDFIPRIMQDIHDFSRALEDGLEEEVQRFRAHFLVLQGQIQAVTARRDLLSQELTREREWIRLLELTLEAHGISFPTYPYKQI